MYGTIRSSIFSEEEYLANSSIISKACSFELEWWRARIQDVTRVVIMTNPSELSPSPCDDSLHRISIILSISDFNLEKIIRH